MGGGGSRLFNYSTVIPTLKPKRIRELHIDRLPTILNLPMELVSDVLVSWVSLRDLRRLDIAFANGLVLKYLLSRATNGVNAGKGYFRVDESERLTGWIATRQIPLQVCHLHNVREHLHHIAIQNLSYSSHHLLELALSNCNHAAVVTQVVQTLIEVNTNLQTLCLQDSMLPEDFVDLLPQLTTLACLSLINCTCSATANRTAHTVHTPTVRSLHTSGAYPFSLQNSTRDAVAYPSLTALDACLPSGDVDLSIFCKPDKLTALQIENAVCSTEAMTTFLGQVNLLRSISFIACQELWMEAWTIIFRGSPSIESVSLSTGGRDIGQGGFSVTLCTKCAASLRDLRLDGVFTSVDIAFLYGLVKRCNKLQHLQLRTRCPVIRSSSLHRVVRTCPALTYLELQCCLLDDALLQCIGENCPQLMTLCGNITTCPDPPDPALAVPGDGMATALVVPEAGMVALINGCRQLRTINLLPEKDDSKREQARRLWGAKYPQVTFI